MSYVSKEQIEQAKQLDLLTYLQVYEPYELVRCSRNVYCTRTHDSLKISNGKWFWWSRGIGGRSALDYLIKVKGLTFLEAVLELTGQASIERPHRDVQHDILTSSSKEFKLPERSGSNQRVITYLKNEGLNKVSLNFVLYPGDCMKAILTIMLFLLALICKMFPAMRLSVAQVKQNIWAR